MNELKDLNNEIQTLSDSSVEHRRLTRAFFKIYTCVVNTYNAIKSIRLKLGTLESKVSVIENALEIGDAALISDDDDDTNDRLRTVELRLSSNENKTTTLESNMANVTARVTNIETQLEGQLEGSSDATVWKYRAAPWDIVFCKQGRIVTVQIQSDGSIEVPTTGGAYVTKLSLLPDELRPLCEKITIITNSTSHAGFIGEWRITYENNATVMKLAAITGDADFWSEGSSAYISYD